MPGGNPVEMCKNILIPCNSYCPHVRTSKIDQANKRISLKSAASVEQEETASTYMSSQSDDGETYNPFATLLKK